MQEFTYNFIIKRKCYMQYIELKKFRKSNKLTQIDIATYLGVSREFISMVEHGKSKLPLNHLEKIFSNEKGWDVSMLDRSELATISGDPLIEIIKSQQKTIELQAKTIELQTQMLEQADREKRFLAVRENGPAGCADAAGQ